MRHHPRLIGVESVKMFRRARHAVVAVIGAALAVSVGCEYLEEPKASPGSAVTVTALDTQTTLTLAPDEVRAIVVQVLDAKGEPIDGVTVFFVRGEPAVIDFDSIDAGIGTLLATTDTAQPFGLKIAGVAQARVRMRAGTAPGMSEVFAIVTPSGDVDAAPPRLVARFIVTVPSPVVDAGGTD